MNTVTERSLSFGLFSGTILAALLLAPTASQAQQYNTATGADALYSLTTGYDNTADGYQALFYNTTGNYNMAIGSFALFSNSTGGLNTALGSSALYSNTTGNYNTATGSGALANNTTGFYNTANGLFTLNYNTTGNNNTANGASALNDNTTGNNNTANGFQALFGNTTGNHNTANGVNALTTNDSGSYNTADGLGALASNTTGWYNSANGTFALNSNSTGNYNTANGVSALYSTTGSSNIALGYNAGSNITTGSNNIAIGNLGASGDNGVIRIGTKGAQTDTYIAGINGVTASGAVPVYINANGKLGTITSSARFKYDIHNMGATSDKLMDLHPVMFRYKEASEDGTHPLQFGLIAEEVAKVYPDLVQYDKQGKPFTVYYHLLTPMMLNELQKAHQQLAIQQTEISSLKAIVHNQSAGSQIQNSALQNQVTSLQHTVQQLLMVFAASILVALFGAAYVVIVRIRRIPLWQGRPMENCVP